MSWMPGDFICSTGYLRSGKTMNAVRIAYGLYAAGWPVVSNIDVSFSSRRLKWLEDVYEVRGSVILIDEVQDSFDSRTFTSNATATRQGIFFGKRGNIILMTTPHFGMLDLRFRQLTQHIFMLRKVRYKSGYASVVQRCWYPGVGDKLLSRGKFLMRHAPLYGLYDTLDENTALLPNPDLADVDDTASRQKGRKARRDGFASTSRLNPENYGAFQDV